MRHQNRRISSSSPRRYALLCFGSPRAHFACRAGRSTARRQNNKRIRARASAQNVLACARTRGESRAARGRKRIAQHRSIASFAVRVPIAMGSIVAGLCCASSSPSSSSSFDSTYRHELMLYKCCVCYASCCRRISLALHCTAAPPTKDGARLCFLLDDRLAPKAHHQDMRPPRNASHRQRSAAPRIARV